jgi:hypothetical protein
MSERASRVVMGGLMRDGEGALDRVVDFIDAVRGQLPELEVYIFENNSRDRTAALLERRNALTFTPAARRGTWTSSASLPRRGPGTTSHAGSS